MSDTENELENTIGILTKEPLEASIKEAFKETVIKLVKRPLEQLLKKHRRILMSGIIILFTLLVFYLGMALFFTNHFYFGTKINGVNVSGKTLGNVKAVMSDELKDYTLSLKERGGIIEQIKAEEIGLKYFSEDEFKKILDSQSGLGWASACVTSKASEKTVVYTFDDKLLKERLNQLSCFKPENIVEPKNPSFKYINKSYVIVDGTVGNKVDKDLLYSHVADSIRYGEPELDLESTGCYEKSQYNSKSKIIINAKNTLNKYVATKITYTIGDNKEILDGSKINQWISADKNYKVEADKNKVKGYIDELSDTYNTVGKTRKFKSSSGKTINVKGGDYGWIINKDKEIIYLNSAIKAGKTATRKPEYSKKAFYYGKNDIGKTYVEISIERQHIWFYKKGSLLVQGDVVTGNIRENHPTRKGVYSLKYRSKNVILRGPGYAVHVDYWMPFDGGIGMHDANWRYAFGHNIYKTNGSHGCVNCPYYVAQKIFNNISPGTPVICY